MSRFAVRRWFISPASGLVAAIIVILLAAILSSTPGRNSPRAANAASTVLPTPTAPATPKPLSTGALSGVYDILVSGGAADAPDKNIGLFHCIARIDHEAGDNRVKVAAQCYVDTNALGDPNSALANIQVSGEGPDGIPGPPPPPPYTTARPAKGSGFYYPGTDKLVTVTCFPNVGGLPAPNIIWVVDVNQASVQLAASGKQQGTLYIYGNQSRSQCNSLTPGGPIFGAPLPIKQYQVGNGAGGDAPWRTEGVVDYDNDGCTDFQELDKTGAFTCGDDPWNPYDSGAASGDLNGSWYMQVTARPADSCRGGLPRLTATFLPDIIYNCGAESTGPGADECSGAADGVDNDFDGFVDDGCGGAGDPPAHNAADGTFVPGAYYHCYAYITQPNAPASKNLTADVLCYIDFGPRVPLAGADTNGLGPGTPQNVNTEQCGTCSGDGKPGAAPPGRTNASGDPALFADIPKPSDVNGTGPFPAGRHTHLTGSIDNTKNTFRLRGCIEDMDKQASLGWMYVDLTLQRYTWQGLMYQWWFQSQADCENGTPVGTVGQFQHLKTLPIEAVRESADPNRDTDQDGCPDKNELSDTPGTGGLRDPSNPWDYFNPANNAANNSADITAVVTHYGHPPGDPLYNTKYDRGGAIPGSNPWNFRPPNGNISSGDITAAVNSYGHNCGVAINKTPTAPGPTVTPVPPKSPPPPAKTLPSFPLPTP